MIDYKYYSNYKNDDDKRNAFFELTKEVFDFSLKSFYERGLWDENYVCHSFFQKDRCIANISVYHLKLVINNEQYNAVQLGAVSVTSEMRGRGLARKLMEIVLNEYSDITIKFLFANKNVLDFYPKFGFKKIDQILPFLNVVSGNEYHESLKISPTFDLITAKSSEQKLYSSIFDAVIPAPLFLLGVENHDCDCRYIEELNTIIAGKKDDRTYHLYGVFTDRVLSFDRIKPYLLDSETDKVIFHFTPDWICRDYEFEYDYNPDDTMFLLTDKDLNLKAFRFPDLLHT